MSTPWMKTNLSVAVLKPWCKSGSSNNKPLFEHFQVHFRLQNVLSLFDDKLKWTKWGMTRSDDINMQNNNLLCVQHNLVCFSFMHHFVPFEQIKYSQNCIGNIFFRKYDIHEFQGQIKFCWCAIFWLISSNSHMEYFEYFLLVVRSWNFYYQYV